MSASGNTNLLREAMLGTEDTPYGVCFLSGTHQPLGQETALVSTASSTLWGLDKQDPKKGDCQTLPRQAMTVLQIFLLLKKVCQIF